MAMVQQAQQAQAAAHQEQQQEEEEACGPIPIAQLEVRAKAGFVEWGKNSRALLRAAVGPCATPATCG
jgi:hypothetical protein